MVKKTYLLFSMFVFATLLSLTPRASADTIDGIIGTTVSYNVTLDNTGDPDALYLNQSNYTLEGPLVVNDLLFTNFPLLIAADSSIDGTLFTVELPAGMAPGLYDGSYFIYGGFDPGSQDLLAEIDFTVNAQAASNPVPEPGTWLLVMTGLGGLGTVAYGRHRSMAWNRAA